MFSSWKSRILTGLGILCAVLAAGSVQAQVISLPPASPPAAITTLEYFLDTDPGFGNGTVIPVTEGLDITTSPAILLSSLPAGIHRLYLRARDANGIWGLTQLRLFYLAPGFSFSTDVPADVTALEYFFDTDPGFGMAASLPVLPGADITTSGSVNTALLSEGVHYFGLRAKNSIGQWGLTTLKPVYVLPNITLPAHAAAAPIVQAEYFVDTDPGFGLATPIPVTSGAAVAVSGFIADVGTLGSGVHHMVLRLRDAHGNWSLSNLGKLTVIVAEINIPPATAALPFNTLEYFFDTDPGMGNGTLLTVPATTDLSSFSFTADVSGLADGPHVLFVRTVGQWSITSSQSFTIGAPLPVNLFHFNARRQGTMVQLEWETAREKDNAGFVIERSTDARMFDSLGFVPAQAGSMVIHKYTFPDKQPLAGISYYRLKQKDLSGAVTYSPTVAIRFDNQSQQLFACNNPVHNELRIFSNGHSPAQPSFIICNLQGRAVARYAGSGKSLESFDVSALPTGSYLLQARINETVQNLRFQKL